MQPSQSQTLDLPKVAWDTQCWASLLKAHTVGAHMLMGVISLR